MIRKREKSMVLPGTPTAEWNVLSCLLWSILYNDGNSPNTLERTLNNQKVKKLDNVIGEIQHGLMLHGDILPFVLFGNSPTPYQHFSYLELRSTLKSIWDNTNDHFAGSATAYPFEPLRYVVPSRIQRPRYAFNSPDFMGTPKEACPTSRKEV